jgi:hypothetical protein
METERISETGDGDETKEKMILLLVIKEEIERNYYTMAYNNQLTSKKMILKSTFDCHVE